jgi:hypothetical protein
MLDKMQGNKRHPKRDFYPNARVDVIEFAEAELARMPNIQCQQAREATIDANKDITTKDFVESLK